MGTSTPVSSFTNARMWSGCPWVVRSPHSARMSASALIALKCSTSAPRCVPSKCRSPTAAILTRRVPRSRGAPRSSTLDPCRLVIPHFALADLLDHRLRAHPRDRLGPQVTQPPLVDVNGEGEARDQRPQTRVGIAHHVHLLERALVEVLPHPLRHAPPV